MRLGLFLDLGLVLWLLLGVYLLLVPEGEHVHQIDPPVPTVYLKDLEFAGKAAHDQQRTCYCFVHLHYPCNVVLQVLQAKMALLQVVVSFLLE